MYFFVDTETADLPRRWNAPVRDLTNWPRVVQFGWVVCDADGVADSAQERLIQPDGFTISRGAFDRHGISTEHAREHGVELGPVLEELAQALENCSVVVAHNVSFDSKVLGAEFLRAGMEDVVNNKKLRCTMKESADFCQLPGKYGPKWPTLTELHTILFGESFSAAHAAAADCLACMRCFFRLKEKGVIRG